MHKLGPVDWLTLTNVLEADGFVRERTQASLLVLAKPGVARAVVIPRYSQIRAGIILAYMRTAGMSRRRYFALLERVRSSRMAL